MDKEIVGWPRGMVQGERRKEGSGWGTRVYLWQIHVDIWQNQYNIVKLKNKIKLKKKECSVRNAKVLGFHVRFCEWTFQRSAVVWCSQLLQPRPPQKQCRWNFKAHPHADRATKLPQSRRVLIPSVMDVLKTYWNVSETLTSSSILQASLKMRITWAS